MNPYRIGVLPGDGIGPEVVPAAIELIDTCCRKAGVDVEWVELLMGWEAIRELGDPMPASTKEALSECHGWIMGPHDSAAYPAEWHQQRRPLPGGELRRDFDLYSNIRPAKNLPGVRSLIEGVDLVIYRENTEGTYADRNMARGHGEFMPSPDMALSVGVYTRKAVERIVRAAFEAATTRSNHLTVVHKANVLTMTTGMYRDIALEMAGEYPAVTVDDYHVDAFAALLVRKAAAYDVIVSDNMFGDILSDLSGELVGGLGLSGGLNAGDRYAMAQAVHGSAPDIAGTGTANPIGEIISSVMLLRWLATRESDELLDRAADAAEHSVHRALGEGVLTKDLGGDAGTAEFVDACLVRLDAEPPNETSTDAPRHGARP